MATEGTGLAEGRYSTSGLPKILWISASFHGIKKKTKNNPNQKIREDKLKDTESLLPASLSSAGVVSDGNFSEVQNEQPKVKQISIPQQ